MIKRILELQILQKNKLQQLINNETTVTPAEFLANRRTLFSSSNDFTGVYILHNCTKDLYYVGQGKKVFQRVYNHFTGHGNGDVYADYKYGDHFTISMLSLTKSGYNSLNDLEREMIYAYDAYTKGYNRTRGNRR